MAIHRLRRLGENQSGDKGGLELPRDDLRAEGLLEDGKLVEQPQLVIDRVDDGEWRVRRVDR
jgi:phenylpropionate dioxygenase-like ring-hydroxylating dioxygenase large terminal subunit